MLRLCYQTTHVPVWFLTHLPSKNTCQYDSQSLDFWKLSRRFFFSFPFCSFQTKSGVMMTAINSAVMIDAPWNVAFSGSGVLKFITQLVPLYFIPPPVIGLLVAGRLPADRVNKQTYTLIVKLPKMQTSLASAKTGSFFVLLCFIFLKCIAFIRQANSLWVCLWW